MSCPMDIQQHILPVTLLKFKIMRRSKDARLHNITQIVKLIKNNV